MPHKDISVWSTVFAYGIQYFCECQFQKRKIIQDVLLSEVGNTEGGAVRMGGGGGVGINGMVRELLQVTPDETTHLAIGLT